MGRQPRRHRLQPVAVAPRRPRPSRRAARRPRSHAGHHLGRGAADGDGRARRAGRARAARLPEDLGVEGDPRQRADRAASGTSSRCAGRRSRWRARSSAARPTWPPPSGGRRSATACSSTTTRTRATAPSPPATPSGPTPDARVSCALAWDEVPDAEPGDLRLDTVPERLRTVGDPAADIDLNAGSLDQLLDLARRDEEGGLGDAPWPPHFPKQRGEPKRVQPSRDRDRPTQRGRAGDPQPGGPPPGVNRRPAARLRLQAPDRPGPRARVRLRLVVSTRAALFRRANVNCGWVGGGEPPAPQASCLGGVLAH